MGVLQTEPPTGAEVARRSPLSTNLAPVKSRLALGLLLILALADCKRRKPISYPTFVSNEPRSGVTISQPSATATATTTAPPAEVTDADRTAARDLYNAGTALQQQGKHADALDKFQRSVAVFPAPTTLLHVAQCKIALGRLVEAAEDYRAIINVAMPNGSPAAFYDAQKAAGQELKDLEPRVPHTKVLVTPDKTPGLQVTIDGQPLNPALIGVTRPIDPGAHKIVATAPGYITAELAFGVKERESKDVPLLLKKK